MQIGNQRFPHKYIRRVKRGGKFIYIYPNGEEASLRKETIVIAHGKPTPLLVDPRSGYIVTGPPNLLGRELKISNKKSGYYAKAVDPTGSAPDTYCYPEDHIKTVTAKKAAKFLRVSRSLNCLNKSAESMMGSPNPITRDYGLAIWLNNNSQMRVGAHADAASVDPIERRKIITLARKEGWSSAAKQAAFKQARQNTYGLLTLRKGHVTLNQGGKSSATFRFLGKGGKDNTYTVLLNDKVRQALFNKLYVNNPDPSERFFNKKVNYKRIWREYKKYKITPHISRGAYADTMVNRLMSEFRITSADTGKAAFNRFNAEITKQVSDKLNHSRSITEKSYLSPMTQQALKDFRDVIRLKTSLRESLAPLNGDISEALGEVLLWRELGVGNTFI